MKNDLIINNLYFEFTNSKKYNGTLGLDFNSPYIFRGP